MPEPVTISVTVDARGSEAGVRQVEVNIDRLGRAQARMTQNASREYRLLAQAINQSFELNQAAFTRMLQHQEREMRTFRDRRVQLERDAARDILQIEQKLQEDIRLLNDRSNRRLTELNNRRLQELSRASQRLNPQGAYQTTSGQLRYASGAFAPQSALQDIQREQAARAAINQRYANLELALNQRTADRVYDLRRAGQTRVDKVQQDGLKKLESIQKGEETATARHRNQISTMVENSVRSTNAKVQQMAKETAFSFESVFGANFFANLAANAIQGLVQRITGALRSSIGYAARTEELGVAMTSMAKAANISSAAIQAQADVVSHLNITTQETRVVLTRMLQAQLDVTKATDLAVAAQDLAVVTGTATAETYERLILGITTMQPRLLRTAGVYTTLTELMRENKKETGQSAISLSSYQKQQLLLNEVLEQAARDVGNYDAAMNTAGKQMRTSVRIVDDLKNAFGKQFLASLQPLIKELNRLGDAFTRNIGSFDAVLALLTLSFLSFAASAVKAVPVLKSLAGAFIGMFTPMGTLAQFYVKGIQNNVAMAGSTRAVAVAQLQLLGITRTTTLQSALATIQKNKELALLQIEAALTSRVITMKEAETLVRLAAADAKRAESAATLVLVNSQRGLAATAAAATGGISLLVAGLATLLVYLSATSESTENLREVTADQAAEGIRLLNVLALQNKALAESQKILAESSGQIEENSAAYKKLHATLDLVSAADRANIVIQKNLFGNVDLVNNALQRQIDLNNKQIETKQKLIALTLQERTATIQTSGAEVERALADLKVLENIKNRLGDRGGYLSKQEDVVLQRNLTFYEKYIGNQNDLENALRNSTAELSKHGEASEKAKADIELFSEQIAKNIVQVRKNQVLQGETVEVYGESREALKKVGQTNEYVIGVVDKYIRKLEQSNEAMHTAEKAAEDLSDALAKIKAPDIDLTKTAVAFAELQSQIVERRKLLFEAVQQNVIPRQLGAADVENILGVGAKDFISAQEKFYNAFKSARGSTATLEEFREQLKDTNSEASNFVKQQIAIADTQFAKDLAESGASIENWNDEARQAVIESAKLAAQAKEENLFTTTEKQARESGREIVNLKREITSLQNELNRLLAGDDAGENLDRQKRRLEEQKNLVRSIFDTANELNINLGALPNDAEVLRKLDFRLQLLTDIRDARRELNLEELKGEELGKLTIEGARAEEQRLEAVRDVRNEIKDALDAQFNAENRLTVLKITQGIPAVKSEVLAQTQYLEILRDRRDAEQSLTADLAVELRLRADAERDFAVESEKSITKAIGDRLRQTREANEKLREDFATAVLISNEHAFDFLPSVQQALREAANLPDARNPVLSEIKNTNDLLKTEIITKLDKLVQNSGKDAGTINYDQYLSPETKASLDRALQESKSAGIKNFADFVAQVSEIASFQTPAPPPGLRGLGVNAALSRIYSPGRGSDQNEVRTDTEFLRSQGVNPAAYSNESDFVNAAVDMLAKLANQRLASSQAQSLLATPSFALQTRSNAIFGTTPIPEQGEAIGDALKRLNIRENAVEAARQQLETDKEVVKILDVQTRETNRLAQSRIQIDRQTAVRIGLDLEDENIQKEIFRLTEKGLRTEEGLLAKTEILKKARNDRDIEELNNIRELTLLREDAATDYIHSVDFQRRAFESAEIAKRRTAEEVSQKIYEAEYNYIHFAEGAADRYRLAWLEAYNAVKQADEDAVVSQIQSQVKLDDALTLHSQQVRASVYEHMASQKTFSEGIAEGINSLYDNVFEKMSNGIDRLTEKWGAFGNFFNSVLKSISAQFLNRATKTFVDMFFPPDNQSGLGGSSTSGPSGEGGLLGTIKNIFGLGGSNRSPASTTTATQTMVVNAGNVVITGPGIGGGFSGGLPALGGGIPFLGANAGLRTTGGVNLSNLGNAFSFANQFTAPGSASSGVSTWNDIPASFLNFRQPLGTAGAAQGGGFGGLLSSLSGLGRGAALSAPLIGAGLGASLGAGSGIGSILGGVGGGIAGLGLLGGLSAAGLIGGGLGVGASTASAGLFGALGLGGFATSIGTSIGGTLGAIASFAIPAAIIAAPLLVGAYFLARNAKRRREEKARDQFTGDALSQLNNILRQVTNDRMDGGEAISQALQIRAQYLQAANSLTDKKTRQHAMQDISRIDILIGKINYAADKQLERQNIERKLAPEFAAGGRVSANQHFSLIKVRPGEEILYPDGSSQVVPGIDRGRDSVYTFAQAGTQIFTKAQRNALQSFSYGGYVKQMKIPHFDMGGVVFGPSLGGSNTFGMGFTNSSFNRQSASSVRNFSTGKTGIAGPESDKGPIVLNLTFRGNIDSKAIVFEGLQASDNREVVVKITRQAQNDRKSF